MFIGREKEKAVLKEFYDKYGTSLTVIYGRRRVGKSTLISEFSRDKKTIFYTATKVGRQRNLELFSKQVARCFLPGISDVSFNTLEAVFDFLDKCIGHEKILLVIDELSYWAEDDEALLSVLQKYIDTVWNEKNLKIILCGSSLSFMENGVLGEKSPLFGRRDYQIKLGPFDYMETAEFVPQYSNEDKALCYAITGGVAKYLSLINPEKSIDENIVRLFFRPEGYLYEEARNLITQEFSDVSIVNNIIEQIAGGENTLNAISAKIREKESTVLYSLDKLISIGLVERKKCMTDENNRKKTQFVLKDNMLRFWYKYIPGSVSVIEMGEGECYYNTFVKPGIHGFMGPVFEEMCRYYTLRKGVSGLFGCMLTSVGTWWGTENIKDDRGRIRAQSADIDVVGIAEGEKKAVIGECKFKNERIDRGIYETLFRRAGRIASKYKIVKYILFSLSGYTDWFDEMKDEDVLLLTLDSLYEEHSERTTV